MSESTRGFVCPACVQETSYPHPERIDGYNVFICRDQDCLHIWRTPVLGHVRMTHGMPREGEKYRGSHYHESHCEREGIRTFAQRWDHDYAVAKMRVEKIVRLRPPRARTLIDLGCGNGAFVTAALDAGYNAFGMDTGEPILDWAQDRDERLRKRLLVGTFPPVIALGWDVVTAHDVLEHLPDPYACLDAASRAMPYGSLLVLEEPDPGCPEALMAGARFRHVKPREHTMLPSRKTWSAMLREAGFAVIQIDEPVPTKMRIVAERRR